MQQSRTATSPVSEILQAMTLEEKAGQMTQVTLDTLCHEPSHALAAARLDPDLLASAVVGAGIGSILNVAGGPLTAPEWRILLTEIQRVAVEETRLGIPILVGLDAVHGSGYTRGAAVFPHNLSMAATWRPELARAAARMTAVELSECGVPWNFAPVLDVARTPLWSRMVETYGEDKHLATEMGLAAIQGHRDVPGIASCAKHFIGYSAPQSGRDRTTAWLPDSLLRDVFLPPFAAAVEAGVPTIMVNSGDINGIPVHASRALLTDLLRDELGFAGLVVTDWEDVIKLHTLHCVAPTVREAVRIAIEAGIDMSMTPYDVGFAEEVVGLVRDGEIPESRIDESVTRILELKADLGLFANPLTVPSGFSGNRTEVNRECAASSLVLLENDGILPLRDTSRVRIIGDGADSMPALCGPWTMTWQGDDPGAYPASEDTLEATWTARFPGANSNSTQEEETVVLCLSETPSVEKPGDILDLTLDEDQQKLGSELVASGKRVVALLLFDRPRVLGAWIESCAAVVWCGRPGTQGANAIIGLLLGESEPDGRLPFTYPRHTGELVTYDHRRTDRLGKLYGLRKDYKFDGFDPRWRFGHGRSYTTFETHDLQVDLHESGARVSVTVSNTGGRAGRQVVAVYLSDLYATVAPRVELLAGFDSVQLRAGESRRVDLQVPESAFGFNGPVGFVIEPGEFKFRVENEEVRVHVEKS
jgi:beta-glucosidase